MLARDRQHVNDAGADERVPFRAVHRGAVAEEQRRRDPGLGRRHASPSARVPQPRTTASQPMSEPRHPSSNLVMAAGPRFVCSSAVIRWSSRRDRESKDPGFAGTTGRASRPTTSTASSRWTPSTRPSTERRARPDAGRQPSSVSIAVTASTVVVVSDLGNEESGSGLPGLMQDGSSSSVPRTRAGVGSSVANVPMSFGAKFRAVVVVVQPAEARGGDAQPPARGGGPPAKRDEPGRDTAEGRDEPRGRGGMAVAIDDEADRRREGDRDQRCAGELPPGRLGRRRRGRRGCGAHRRDRVSARRRAGARVIPLQSPSCGPKGGIGRSRRVASEENWTWTSTSA